MDKSGVIVGGAIGVAITAVIFAVLLISSPETVKPEISVTNGHSVNIVGEVTPVYSKELSLVEIF